MCTLRSSKDEERAGSQCVQLLRDMQWSRLSISMSRGFEVSFAHWNQAPRLSAVSRSTFSIPGGQGYGMNECYAAAAQPSSIHTIRSTIRWQKGKRLPVTLRMPSTTAQPAPLLWPLNGTPTSTSFSVSVTITAWNSQTGPCRASFSIPSLSHSSNPAERNEQTT